MRTSEKRVHLIFVLSVLLKLINGVLEVVLGTFFLFATFSISLIQTFVHNELIDDPTDLFANTVQHFLPFLSHSQYFISIYLLSHGIVKIFLVAGLLRKRLWAYPTAIVVFVLFIVYQVYRYVYTLSPWLILLTVFDLFVIWLTWHEYNVILSKQSK